MHLQLYYTTLFTSLMQLSEVWAQLHQSVLKPSVCAACNMDTMYVQINYVVQWFKFTVTPSPTVTHSPVMMGGVNVAAAVAIPVVLVLLLLLLLVIGVVASVIAVYKICIPKWHQEVLEKSQDHYNFMQFCMQFWNLLATVLWFAFEYAFILTHTDRKIVCLVLSKKTEINHWTFKFTFFPHDFLDVRIQFYLYHCYNNAYMILYRKQYSSSKKMANYYRLNLSKQLNWKNLT